MAGGHVQLVGLRKEFGEDVVAVDDIDVEIVPGEFFSLLGPSGCGKTTTLRLIAGFERPTSGRIDIDGEDMSGTPPHLRPVNTVFQNYALFPHLDVAENVAFGLRYLNLSKSEIGTRVDAILELVRLSGLGGRRPNQLSGGQQQRVALARALVLEPRVLLLDEPLGALDAKLRKSLQFELKALQEAVGITFLYVTHDQEEALTMSDRLAVMESGRIAQVGLPSEVYERPTSAYVADFLGVSNLMDVEVHGDGHQVRLGGHGLKVSTGPHRVGPAHLSIRPERILIRPPLDMTENVIPATVERVVYAGATMQLLVKVDDAHSVQVVVPNQGVTSSMKSGDAIGLEFPADALQVLASQPTPDESYESDFET